MDDVQPRRLRPIQAPLGAYFRPNRNDHTDLLSLLVEQRFGGSGIVVSPRLMSRQSELIDEARSKGIEVVLDTLALELSTLGGFHQSGMEQVPWVPASPESPDDFDDERITELARLVASYAVEKDVTAVLAPTHYVESPQSRWLDIDLRLFASLRMALDASSGPDIALYYPLATSSTVIREESFRDRVLSPLFSQSVDALWLRVHPFGTTTSGPLALRRYIEACRHLHQLDVPIVAERTGTVGVALLAFGAVGELKAASPLERGSMLALL